MSDRLWNLYVDIVFAEHYTSLMVKRWSTITRLVNIATAIITLTSVTQMVKESTPSLLWAVLTVLAQAFSVAFPYTKLYQTSQALSFYANAITKLKISVSSMWNGWFYCGSLPNEETILRLEADFIEQQNFFLGSEPIGKTGNSCFNEATKLTEIELSKYAR